MYRVTLNERGQKVCSLVPNRAEFLRIIDSPANKAACMAAMAGEERKKKQQVQMACQCNPMHNGGLLRGAKFPTQLLMVDVDYDTSQSGWQDQMERDTQRIMAAKEEAGVLFLQRTRKGLHIIMSRPDITVCQSENLKLAAAKLGVQPDMNAKDITRVFYCGDSSTLLHINDDVFAVEDVPYVPEPDEARLVTTGHVMPCPYPAQSSQLTAHGSQLKAHGSQAHLSTDGRPKYKGLAFGWEEIIATYWRLNGGEPRLGNRNTGTLELAQQLSYFTPDETILDSAIPAYDGLSETEKLQCIRNGLTARPTVIPRKLRNVMETIMAAEAHAQAHQQLMRTWPQGLKESMAVAPTGMQTVYLIALSTAIGALATGVQTEYNGKRNHLSLMSFVCGEAGSGKGSLTNVVKAWTAIFRTADALNYAKETEWKKEKRKARNQQQQPEEPDLEYRMLTLNSTLPNFVLRLQQTNGKHAYAYSPEADVVCSKWHGEMLEFGNISRIAWDNDDYNREAKSEEAVSVHLPALKLNWLLAGTPDALYRLIPHSTDGLVSRLCLAATPDNTFAELTMHKQLTPAQEERIAQVATLLTLMQGCIHPTRVETRAIEWVEGIRAEAEQQQDRALARARMRVHENAVRITTCILLVKSAETLIKAHGFEGAKALLAANPQAWIAAAEKAQTPAMVDLVDDVADYLIDQQMRYFRARIEKKYASADYATAPIGRRPAANDAVYTALPQTFSFQAAVKVTAEVKGKAVSRNSVSCMLRRWAQAGKVQPQAEGYVKC